jgi:hypothetical protein
VSNTYALVLATVLLIWTVVASALNKRLWLSVLPHNAAWILGCAIVGSGLLNYEPLSAYAWVLITSAIIAYNMGVAISCGRSGQAPAVTVGESTPLTSLRVYAALLLLFVAGLVVYLWTIAVNYGLGTLIWDPGSIRAYSEIGYLEQFPLYGKLLFYLGPLCFVLAVHPRLVHGLSDSPVALRMGIAAFLLIAQSATLQRTNVFVCIVWAAGVALLQLGRPSSHTQKRRVTTGVGALLAFGIIGLVIFQGLAVALGKTGTENRDIAYSVSPSLRSSPLTGVLHYAASGVPAFGKLVESRNDAWPSAESQGIVWGDYNPQTWGAATLAGPLKLVPGIERWREIAPFTRLPAPTNVYTWLEPWYRDFRAPGVIFGALGVGLFVGNVANPRTDSPRLLMLGGLVLGLTAMATFINRYAAVMTIVLYFAVWWLGRPGLAVRDQIGTPEHTKGQASKLPV